MGGSFSLNSEQKTSKFQSLSLDSRQQFLSQSDLIEEKKSLEDGTSAMKVSDSKLVSIFLPFYNDKDFLGEAILACQRQSHDRWELFLFDHASTDGSAEIAKSFLTDKRIRYLRASENLGAGSGLNLQHCLPKMRGKYLKLLCADDEMREDCLAECLKFMESNPSIDFCFSDMQFIDGKGKKLSTKWSIEREGVNFNNDEKKTLKTLFEGKSHLAYPTSFLKLNLIRELPLNTTFIMLFDVWLWTTLLISGKKIGFIPKTLMYYRCHEGQMSSINNAYLAQRRSYFENSNLVPIYFKIKDINIIKYLIKSEFSNSLKEGDDDLIPFVVAHHYFSSGIGPFDLIGFNKISDLLNDPYERKRIRERFDYGIKEFRKEYSYPKPVSSNGDSKRFLNEFRNKANTLTGGDLSFNMLIFLLIKKFYKKLFFRKRKNKYTI